MAEYIEREAVLKVLREKKKEITTWDDFMEGMDSGFEVASIAVEELPAADVAPVVHG